MSTLRFMDLRQDTPMEVPPCFMAAANPAFLLHFMWALWSASNVARKEGWNAWQMIEYLFGRRTPERFPVSRIGQFAMVFVPMMLLLVLNMICLEVFGPTVTACFACAGQMSGTG